MYLTCQKEITIPSKKWNKFYLKVLHYYLTNSCRTIFLFREDTMYFANRRRTLRRSAKAVLSSIVGQFRAGIDVGKDCVIVCGDNIEIEANQIMLLQSPFIKDLIDSRNGNYEMLCLMFPDISYKHMHSVLDYFYTGVIQFCQSDKEIIQDILINILQIPKDRLTTLDSDIGYEDLEEDEDDQFTNDDNNGVNCSSDSQESHFLPEPNSHGLEDDSQSTQDLALPENVSAQSPAASPSSSSSFSGGISSPGEEEEVDEDVAGEYKKRSRLKLKRKAVIKDEQNQRTKTPTGNKRSRHSSGRKVICRKCRRLMEERGFRRHLVTHMYDLWDTPDFRDLGRGLGSTKCPESTCEYSNKNKKNFILHYALAHGDLEKKLEENGKTVENYMKSLDDDSTIDSNDDCDTRENSRDSDDETEGEDKSNGEETDGENVNDANESDDDDSKSNYKDCDDDSEATQPLPGEDNNSRADDFVDED